MSGDMQPYMLVRFKEGDLERGIMCHGPRGSIGLVALYNFCALQFTGMMGTLGPVNETQLKARILLGLEEGFTRQPIVDALKSRILEVIHKPQVLLDASPLLVSPQDFVLTASHWLFCYMGIQLLHGWVLDPEDLEVSLYNSINGCSHDDLLEYLVLLEHQEDQTENLALVRHLVAAAQNQLTDYGFKSLSNEINENGFAVVFCYSRFNVVHKFEGKLYVLETDLLVRHYFPSAVWRFFDGGAREDSILLTGDYSPVEGQTNFNEKVEKWRRAMPTNESNETGSSQGNQSGRQRRRRVQRTNKKRNEKKKATASSDVASYAEAEHSEVSAGDYIKDDSKMEVGGTENKDIVRPAAEGTHKEVTAGEVGQGTENKDIVRPSAEAAHIEVTAGNVIKDDCKKEVGQDTKNDELVQPVAVTEHIDVTAGSSQIASEEKEKSIGNMSLEPLKPEETMIAHPLGIDCVPAAPAQGQSVDVSDFLNFLLGYKYDGHSSYFSGIVEAFKATHSPYFFVPYEFIIHYNEALALNIQDHYPSVCEDLKESVVQYLQKHKVTFPEVQLKILGLPKPKSVQTFETYVASIVLLEKYDVYGGGLDESPSYDGRQMALGYLQFIVDKFKTGRCLGGEWNEKNMRVNNNGSEFIILSKQDLKYTGDLGYRDLLKFSKTVLQRFKGENGKLPAFFDEFDEDCLLLPEPEDSVKWERFLEFISSPFALKHPLVRSAFLCNSYLAADSNRSGIPPRYIPLYSRKDCNDCQEAAQTHQLFEAVLSYHKGSQPRASKVKYLLDPWGITHWSVLQYSRHFIQHVLRYTKGHNCTQQIKDITVVDILLSRRLGQYIAKLVRYIVLECGVDGVFSSAWRHFVASECKDRPQENIGLQDASTIDDLLLSVSEEMVAVACAQIEVPSVAALHKSAIISNADLEEFSSTLERNSLMVIDKDHLQIQCHVTHEGVQQLIKVSKQFPLEGTSRPSVIVVEGPYCEEYHFVFELLGVWLFS